MVSLSSSHLTLQTNNGGTRIFLVFLVVMDTDDGPRSKKK